MKCIYLLIAESHLPSSVAADVHAAQEHSVLTLQADGRRTVVAVHARLLWRHTPAELRLYRVVVLFVDDVVNRVAVDEKVLLYIRRRIKSLFKKKL